METFSNGMIFCILFVCTGVACELGYLGSWYVLSGSKVVDLSGDCRFGNDVDCKTH